MRLDKVFSMSRLVTLVGSILVALSSGTTYLYSAYSPQLGARLQISNTQLNVVGLAGNMGVYFSGPVWGRIVDHKGPRIPLIGASICLLFGYLGIKRMYDDGLDESSTISVAHFAFLVACGFLTGLGGNAGISAAINTTAKSFPSNFRATATGLVMSGLGLSAFLFSLLAQTFFPGNTSAFLLMLAVGTATPMLVGLVIVKPVPLPSSSSVQPIGAPGVPSEDAHVTVGPEMDTEAAAESAPLLSHEQEHRSYQAPVLSSPIKSDNPTSAHSNNIFGNNDTLPDIHGKQLWHTPDFYLVFVIMGICSGTAIMYINNVGSISRALYANTHVVYDEIEASKWQAAQVSILSLGNFAGRILIGLISDFTYARLHVPRASCLSIVSALFVISQATAMAVSTIDTLWIATLSLGLAYGSLFGSFPTTVIEWFGMVHFSENWGFVSFAPVVGGNLFSIIFGRNLDAHASAHGSPSGQCLDGKTCYLATLQVTLLACIVSLGLGLWAAMKDWRKAQGRNACSGA